MIMIDFLIALSGSLGIGAAAIAVIFGHHADVYKELGHIEEAIKYYKIMWIGLGYIILWVTLTLLIPVFLSN